MKVESKIKGYIDIKAVLTKFDVNELVKGSRVESIEEVKDEGIVELKWKG